MDGSADTQLVIPAAPSLAGAMKAAGVDFYYNSWRLVPANAVWGAMLILIVFASAAWLPLIVLVVLLALPTAGLYRMAALIARDEPTSFADFASAIRRWAAPALAVGAMAVLLGAVFTTNVVVGLETDNVVGWLFSAFALYADIALAIYLVAAWPILVDPVRKSDPLRQRLRLAALVGLAHPGRLFVLVVIIGIILIASTVLFAALLTISIAFVALVSARYILPAVDRLEGRATKMVLDQDGAEAAAGQMVRR